MTDILNDAVIYGDLDDAILARPIRIASGRNRRDMQFKTADLTVGKLIVMLTQFGRGPKDGPCILQGALVAGQRIAKNVSHNYILMFDYDTGLTIEEVGTQIADRGLMAVLWTTHSHMKPETTIPEEALVGWLKKAGKWSGHVGNVMDDDAITYLRDEKRIKPEILDGARITRRAIQEGGMLFTVAHKPLPRLRALFVLKDVFDFANRGGTQKDAVDEWKARYVAASEMLGLPYDTACVDPSRLMYLPRIPEDGRIEQGQHEIIVFGGACFDFDALEVSATVRGGGARNAFTDAAANEGTGGRSGGGTETDFGTPGLKKWLAQHGHDFQASDWYASHESDVRFSTHNGADYVCARGEHHTKLDDGKGRDFMVRNAADGQGWVMYCLHEGCQQASGKDRAWYLDFAMQKFGVGVEDLVEFSESARAAATKTEETVKEAAKAQTLGNDDAALKAAIEALDKDDIAAVDAVLAALSARPRAYATVLLVKQTAKKLDVSVPQIHNLMKEHKAAHDAAKKEKAASGGGGDDWFGDAPPSVSSLRAVPKNKKEAAVIWMDWDANDRKHCTVERIHHLNERAPEIFMRPEGGYVQVTEIDEQITAVRMTQDRWHAHLYDSISYRAVDKITMETHEVGPPEDMCRYLNTSMKRPFPILEEVVHVPVFAPNGKLHTTAGYDADLRMWLDPDFDALPLPKTLTEEHLGRALDLLLCEAIRDFPFSDKFDGSEVAPIKTREKDEEGYRLPNWERGPSSRAHALAMLLQPFARNLIDGPCPAYHIGKASPGTGANYLVDVLSIIFEGTRASPMTLPANNDDVRKNVTAALREHPALMFYDNINRLVDGEAFAVGLTTGVWKDRVLGLSETTGPIKIRNVWIFAGNNLKFSDEMYRRLVPIRMDAATPNPAHDRGRADFKHFPLHPWVMANRRELVWACHVLIAWWVQQGMPRSDIVFNSFDEYAAVMGGILEACGVGGFGVCIPDYMTISNDAKGDMVAFAEQVYDTYKDQPFSPKELFEKLKNGITGKFEGNVELSGATEHGQVMALAFVIRQHMEGKTFDITSSQNLVTRLKLVKCRERNPVKFKFITTDISE